MSGFVNAAYAVPNPRFRLRNVRARLYRGRCANNENLDNTLQAYRERRQDVYQVVNELVHLTDKTRKQLIRYIDDFYATIDSPKRLESRLRKSCI
jgi:retron-type reverse transcriptase